jgi:hypothetical protein
MSKPLTIQAHSVGGLPGHLSLGGYVTEGTKDAVGRYAQTTVDTWAVITLLAYLVDDPTSAAEAAESIRAKYDGRSWVSIADQSSGLAARMLAVADAIAAPAEPEA